MSQNQEMATYSLRKDKYKYVHDAELVYKTEYSWI